MLKDQDLIDEYNVLTAEIETAEAVVALHRAKTRQAVVHIEIMYRKKDELKQVLGME